MNIDQAFAERFAAEWVEAWNAHDLERVLSHYAEDFEMSSPYIVQKSFTSVRAERWPRPLRTTPASG